MRKISIYITLFTFLLNSLFAEIAIGDPSCLRAAATRQSGLQSDIIDRLFKGLKAEPKTKTEPLSETPIPVKYSSAGTMDRYAMSREVDLSIIKASLKEEETTEDTQKRIDKLEKDTRLYINAHKIYIEKRWGLVPKGNPLSKVLAGAYKKLLSIMDVKEGGLKFVDCPEINAWAYKYDSVVYVNLGLLYEMQRYCKRHDFELTEDMIVFVIAHELTHIDQRSSFAGIPEAVLKDDKVKKLQKGLEYDADTGALIAMAKAGYNPKEGLKAMSFLLSLGEDTRYFRSHPRDIDRLGELEDLVYSPDYPLRNMNKKPKPLDKKAQRALASSSRHLGDRFFQAQDLPELVGSLEGINQLSEFISQYIFEFWRPAAIQESKKDYFRERMAKFLFLGNINSFLENFGSIDGIIKFLSAEGNSKPMIGGLISRADGLNIFSQLYLEDKLKSLSPHQDNFEDMISRKSNEWIAKDIEQIKENIKALIEDREYIIEYIDSYLKGGQDKREVIDRIRKQIEILKALSKSIDDFCQSINGQDLETMIAARPDPEWLSRRSGLLEREAPAREIIGEIFRLAKSGGYDLFLRFMKESSSKREYLKYAQLESLREYSHIEDPRKMDIFSLEQRRHIYELAASYLCCGMIRGSVSESAGKLELVITGQAGPESLRPDDLANLRRVFGGKLPSSDMIETMMRRYVLKELDIRDAGLADLISDALLFELDIFKEGDFDQRYRRMAAGLESLSPQKLAKLLDILLSDDLFCTYSSMPQQINNEANIKIYPQFNNRGISILLDQTVKRLLETFERLSEQERNTKRQEVYSKIFKAMAPYMATPYYENLEQKDIFTRYSKEYFKSMASSASLPELAEAIKEIEDQLGVKFDKDFLKELLTGYKTASMLDKIRFCEAILESLDLRDAVREIYNSSYLNDVQDNNEKVEILKTFFRNKCHIRDYTTDHEYDALGLARKFLRFSDDSLSVQGPSDRSGRFMTGLIELVRSKGPLPLEFKFGKKKVIDRTTGSMREAFYLEKILFLDSEDLALDLFRLNSEQLLRLLKAIKESIDEMPSEINYMPADKTKSSIKNFYHLIQDVYLYRRYYKEPGDYMIKLDAINILNDMLVRVGDYYDDLQFLPNEKFIESLKREVPFTELIGMVKDNFTQDNERDALIACLVRSYDAYNLCEIWLPVMRPVNPGIEYEWEGLSKLFASGQSRKGPVKDFLELIHKDAGAYSDTHNKREFFEEADGKAGILSSEPDPLKRAELIIRLFPEKSTYRDRLFDSIEEEFLSALRGCKSYLERARQHDFSALSKEQAEQLFEFYKKVIPFIYRGERRSIFQAACYKLYQEMLGGYAEGLEEELKVISETIYPEASLKRDDVLNNLIEKKANSMPEAEKVQAFMTKSLRRSLKEEDIAALDLLEKVKLGTAQWKREERAQFILWLLKASNILPGGLKEAAEKFNMTFDSLPSVIFSASNTEREAFFAYLLRGENGIFTPRNEEDKAFMKRFVKTLFEFYIPANEVDSHTYHILAEVFDTIFATYSPYRRTQLFLTMLSLKDKIRDASVGEKFALFLSAMGAHGAKVGQFLSEQKDLIKDERIRSSLGSLQQAVKRFSKIGVLQVIDESGKSRKVTMIGPCLGSASMGQTHYAKSGKRSLAIKAKRPGFEKYVQDDNVVLDAVTDRLSELGIKLPRLSVTIGKRLAIEGDFRIEGRTMEKMSKLRYKSPEEAKYGYKVRFPKIYDYTDSLIIMEFVRGVTFAELRTLQTANKLLSEWGGEENIPDKAGRKVVEKAYRIIHKLKGLGITQDEINKYYSMSQKEIADIMLDHMMFQLFKNGRFHANFHPANFMVTPNKDLYFIDLGDAGEINRREKFAFSRTVFGCFLKNPDFVISQVESILGMNQTDEVKNGIRDIVKADTDVSYKMKQLYELVTGKGRGRGMDTYYTWMKALAEVKYLAELSKRADEFFRRHKKLGISAYVKNIPGLLRREQKPNKVTMAIDSAA